MTGMSRSLWLRMIDGFADVFGRLHEGERHGVNAEGEAVHEVLLVFSVSAGSGMDLPGRARPLREVTMPLLLASSLKSPSLAVFDHPELEGAVSEHEAIALFRVRRKFRGDRGIYGNSSLHISEEGAEQQLIALGHVQRAFIGEGADTDLGAREVLKDRDGRLVDDFSSRIILMRSTKEELSPWEKLRRKIRTPAAISLERTSRLLDAGPMVARILVSSRNPLCRKRFRQKGTGRPPSSGDDRNGPPFGAQIDALCVFPAVFVPCQVFWARPHGKEKRHRLDSGSAPRRIASRATFLFETKRRLTARRCFSI